jgi:hypothetical protein
MRCEPLPRPPRIAGHLAAALALLVLAMVLAPTAAAQEEPSHIGNDAWETDYERALETARESDRDLLLVFVGSDHDGRSRRLDEQLLCRESFLERAPEAFVLTIIDFPKSPERVASDEHAEQNRALSDRFGIQRLATILLLTADEIEYARFPSLTRADPDQFVDEALRLRREVKPRTVAAHQRLQRFRALVAEAVEDLLDTPVQDPRLPLLEPLVRPALTMDDPELRAKALYGLLATGLATDDDASRTTEIDPENAHGVFDAAARYQAQRAASKRDEDAMRVFVDSVLALRAVGPKEPQPYVSLLAAAIGACDGPLADPDTARELADELEARIESVPEGQRVMLRRLIDKVRGG